MTGHRDDAPGFIPPAALYIHVPICASKCSYCDFYSVPASSLSEGFEDELVGAILERASDLSERFDAGAFKTVYVGGGTPTILSSGVFDSLLEGIGALIGNPGTREPREWTVEANPDSLGPESIEIMRRRGVTRLSIGVQSLDPDELATLGRRHGPEAALGAVRLATEAGMAVSADLIAGIPSPREFPRTIGDAEKIAGFAAELLGAGARHLSVYDLTIEEGTALAMAKSRLRFPNEDEDWDSRRRLEGVLLDAGKRRYEVSNYASIGDECRHNLAYWRMDSYIGAGPGAVSTLARISGTSLRIEELREIVDYRRLSGEAGVETDIGLRDAVLETVMMAFRTSFGLDLAAFRRRFGINAESLIGDTLSTWKERIVAGEPWPGMTESGGPALDGEGLDFLNRFLRDCIEEIDRKPCF
ncbi:MAG: radical SAM family heme chaperone HemW [Rectinemataceae bacterium]